MLHFMRPHIESGSQDMKLNHLVQSSWKIHINGSQFSNGSQFIVQNVHYVPIGQLDDIGYKVIFVSLVLQKEISLLPKGTKLVHFIPWLSIKKNIFSLS